MYDLGPERSNKRSYLQVSTTCILVDTCKLLHVGNIILMMVVSTMAEIFSLDLMGVSSLHGFAG